MAKGFDRKLVTMKAFLTVMCAASLCLGAGCSGPIKVSGSEPSPDGKLALNVVIVGAPHSAFSDQTEKRVYVSIADRNLDSPAYYFKQQFVFDAADLDWKSSWESPTRARLQLFSKNGGRSASNEPQTLVANVIITMIFTREQASNQFEATLQILGKG